MLRCLPIAASLCLAATPAAATGSFNCEIADKSLKVDVQGVFSHGLGEQITNFEGRAELTAKGAPPALRDIAFEREHLTQHWLHGRDLKLRLFREAPSPANASIEIIIEATREGGKDDTDFAGTYRMDVTNADGAPDGDARIMKLKGKVSCSLG